MCEEAYATGKRWDLASDRNKENYNSAEQTYEVEKPLANSLRRCNCLTSQQEGPVGEGVCDRMPKPANGRGSLVARRKEQINPWLAPIWHDCRESRNTSIGRVEGAGGAATGQQIMMLCLDSYRLRGGGTVTTGRHEWMFMDLMGRHEE